MTFAARRINGSMLDEIRELDPVTRLARRRMKKLQEAREESAARGERPTVDDLCKATGLSRGKYWCTMDSAHFGSGKSLDDVMGETSEGADITRRSRMGATGDSGPSEEAAHKEMILWIVKGLQEDERQIFLLRYVQGCTMKLIGETVNLSESRISQMLSAIDRQVEDRIERVIETINNILN